MPPLISSQDSFQCVELIWDLYNHLSLPFTISKENDETFASLYEGILAKKAQYGVKFVGSDCPDGNAAFRDWVLGDDWYKSHSPDEPVPEFDFAMEDRFGPNGVEITTAKQLEEAAYDLVYYRDMFGLEDLIHDDEP